MKAAGLVTTLTDIPMVWVERWQNSQLVIAEVSYCDDTAYPIVSSAETIEAKARQTIEIIAFSFYRFGFTLNYGRAKTEVLFEFRGKGANAARKKIEQTMKLQVTIPVGRIVDVTVTNAYRHVGSMFSVGPSVLPDVKMKTSVMAAHIPQYIRKILLNESLTIKIKTMIAQAYLFSKGLSSASVWPKLGALESSTFDSAMFRIFRLVVGAPRGPESLSNDFILGNYSFPNPAKYIDAERINPEP